MKLEDLMVIDWYALGNVVRFYLGEKGQNGYYGDDWDDAPYEHNAGTVYSEFVRGYIDMAWDVNTIVKEPCAGHYNSPYRKDDFKKRNIPVVAVHRVKGDEYNWMYDNFERCLAVADEKVYLGEPAEELIKKGEVLVIELDEN